MRLDETPTSFFEHRYTSVRRRQPLAPGMAASRPLAPGCLAQRFMIFLRPVHSRRTSHVWSVPKPGGQVGVWTYNETET
jgi:hypothetical protein